MKFVLTILCPLLLVLVTASQGVEPPSQTVESLTLELGGGCLT